jgi:16S rRNA (uracil1498-N3)-methyltransferase
LNQITWRLRVSDRFYIPEFSENSRLEVDGSEAHHMLRVMRMTAGTEIEIFDGKGQAASARIDHVTRKSLIISIGRLNSPARELPFQLEIGVALPKGDRARYLVEKLTELGVSCIVPLITARSTVRDSGGAWEKLNRYVIEACKQCGRNQLMLVRAATRIEDCLAHAAEFDSRLVLHPECPRPFDTKDLRASGSTSLLVGPEGGWTSHEMERMVAAGWQPRQIGERTLRTETAAVAVAALWSVLATTPRP